LLIGLWIAEEYSFEHYHTNYRRIAQNLTIRHTPGGAGVWYSSAVPLEQELRTRYSDLFEKTTLVFGGEEHLVSVGDKKVSAAGLWAEKEFPVIFTFKMLSGSMTSMADPSTALISASLAKSLFGGANPVGKTFRYENKLDLTIGGVFEDLPMNTSYYGTKMVLPWDNKENGYHNTNTNWDDHNAQLYVLLADKVTAEQATARIKNLPTPHIKGWEEDAMLYPLDKFRLYGDFKDGIPVAGGIRYVRMFGIIGGFVLLLACINFMNLSTARSASRAKEVGIRKTVGSLKGQLITQFLSESLLLAALSFVLSLALVQAALPFFNSLSAKNMTLPWNQWLFWLLATGFIFLTGFLAGSYPAFYLSGFKPVRVLKGAFRAGPHAGLARQALVVVQFSVSLTLIIGTIVVYRQIQFTKDRPVGYQKDRLVSVDINTPQLRQHYNALRTELLQRRLVEDIAGSSMKVINFDYRNEVGWRGKRQDQAAVLFTNVNVTPDFGKTIGWRVVQGRDFDRAYATDTSATVINEAAASVIGFKNPIGETLRYDNRNWTVIGVVKNMVVNSPYDKVDPAIFL
ncbi:MAG TPA: ABC transporter permease, partial [Puia sp.]|nr:ABC transporter permease [Puia sp.]